MGPGLVVGLQPAVRDLSDLVEALEQMSIEHLGPMTTATGAAPLRLFTGT